MKEKLYSVFNSIYMAFIVNIKYQYREHSKNSQAKKLLNTNIKSQTPQAIFHYSTSPEFSVPIQKFGIPFQIYKEFPFLGILQPFIHVYHGLLQASNTSNVLRSSFIRSTDGNIYSNRLLRFLAYATQISLHEWM